MASAALFALSNLFCNASDIIEAALQVEPVPSVLRWLACNTLELKQEAAFTLLWLLKRGSFDHAKYAISCNCIGTLVASLQAPCDDEHLTIVLKCFKELLRHAHLMPIVSDFSLVAWMQQAGVASALARFLLIADDRLRRDVHAVLEGIADSGAVGESVLDDSEDVLVAMAGRIRLHE